MSKKSNLNPDIPITDINKDLLHRGEFVENLAKHIMNHFYRSKECMVIGLYGEWGDGKTSLINFLIQVLKNKTDLLFTCKKWIKSFTNKDKYAQIICNFIFKITNIEYIERKFGWIDFKLLSFLIKTYVAYFIFFKFTINTLKIFPSIMVNVNKIAELKAIKFFLISHSDIFVPIMKFYLLCFLIFIPLSKVINILILKPLKYLMWIVKYIKAKLESCIRYKINKSKLIILNFKPWLYTSQDQLIEQFFKQFCEKLEHYDGFEELSKLTSLVQKYSVLIKDPISKGVIFSLADFIDLNSNDLNCIKNEINTLLENQDSKFIIIIDDIDRLSDEEICLIFKLTRSIADFKNTLYILSFDDKAVAKALDEPYKDNGAKYLEKIINIPIHLPILNKDEYMNILLNKIKERFIDKISSNIDNKSLTEELWRKFKDNYNEYYLLLFEGLFKNIRTINRYLNMVEISYLEDEVNIYDLLYIVAIKLFYPELYQIIGNNKKLLCKKFDNIQYLEYILSGIITHKNINASAEIGAITTGPLEQNSKNSLEATKQIFNKPYSILEDEKVKYIIQNIEKLTELLNCYRNDFPDEDRNLYNIELNLSVYLQNFNEYNNKNERDKITLPYQLDDYLNNQYHYLSKLAKEKDDFNIYKTRFDNLIKEIEEALPKSASNDKKEKILGFFVEKFLINLFPNLNSLFNNNFKLPSDKSHLFYTYWDQDLYRDKHICSYSHFEKYFQLSIPYNYLAINDIRKIVVMDFKSIAALLIDIENNSTPEKFKNTLKNIVELETANYIGSDDIHLKEFKEIIKAFIYIYDEVLEKNQKEYNKYYFGDPSNQDLFERYIEWQKIIQEGVYSLIDYVRESVNKKKLFFSSIEELLNEKDPYEVSYRQKTIKSFLDNFEEFIRNKEKNSKYVAIRSDFIKEISLNSPSS